jgi:hypothetical protein
MTNEIYKDIPGYEGLYQVSNFGKVKSLSRKTPDGRLIKEIILKSAVSKKYEICSLYKNGFSKSIEVHKLVCMAFFNHVPCGHKIVVDHINNDKLDNRLENLQLISNRENCSKDAKRSAKYIGISYIKDTKKWKARIKIKGKTVHIGVYLSDIEANKAYLNKLNEISK